MWLCRLTGNSLRRSARRLFQKEAFFGGCGKEAAASSFFDEGVVIDVGLEPEEAELEPVLATGFTVAAT